jgi:deoxyribose-phosphate aldolase
MPLFPSAWSWFAHPRVRQETGMAVGFKPAGGIRTANNP